MIRRAFVMAVMAVGLATTAGCGGSGGSGGSAELTDGDRKFCDTAAHALPSPRSTTGIDLDQKLGDVENKDLQKLGSGVRNKGPGEIKITAKDVVAKCKDLGYTPKS
jgi:hypothetical protein